MNPCFKKTFLLATLVISSVVSSASFAEDFFDSSFFDEPTSSTEKKQEATVETPPAPTLDIPAPSLDIPAPAPMMDIPAPSLDIPAPAPMMDVPAPSLDIPAPAPMMDIPAPTMNIPPPPMDISAPPNAMNTGFGSAPASTASLGQPTESLLGGVSSDIFREMAEMERENATLMLQLKQEQLRSEIDALKTANRQILFDEIERREKMTQARLEWELAQDLKRQDALERKQRAEIRQKQIEAALKREEERRVEQIKKDEERVTEKERKEEERRLQKEKQEAEKLAKEQEELRKRYEANSFVQANDLKPTLMSVTRPVKVNRSLSSQLPKTLTLVGEDLLAKKKAGLALVSVDAEIDGKKVEAKPLESATTLYTVAEIRGTKDTLIAKLFTKKDRSTLFVKKSTILPTGHVVVEIDKDFVLVEIQGQKQIIAFPSAGLAGVTAVAVPLSEGGGAMGAGAMPQGGAGAPPAEQPAQTGRSRPSLSASRGAPTSFSGVSVAR